MQGAAPDNVYRKDVYKRQGYVLYCKMLNEAVKHLKGEMEEETFNTTMDLNVDAYIPDSYIPNEYQKLDIYKRGAAIENEEEM